MLNRTLTIKSSARSAHRIKLNAKGRAGMSKQRALPKRRNAQFQRSFPVRHMPAAQPRE